MINTGYNILFQFQKVKLNSKVILLANIITNWLMEVVG